MMRKLYPPILLVGLNLVTVPAVLSAVTPTAQIKSTVEGVIAVLKDPELDQQRRREKIASLIEERFNFAGMSQRVLARNWRKATAEEKERFIDLFTSLLSRTYLSRIEAYTDERVEYVGEKTKQNKYALVDTVIVTKSVEIPVSYKLELRADEWFVYDVVIEGVSLVRNFRSSYQEIVNEEGINGLLAKMEETLVKPATPSS